MLDNDTFMSGLLDAFTFITMCEEFDLMPIVSLLY